MALNARDYVPSEGVDSARDDPKWVDYLDASSFVTIDGEAEVHARRE